ncbi:thioredoxin-like protein [Lactifluus subvellereus]|nr:thioredoxin-like protein [Lactifluus subvellereus]
MFRSISRLYLAPLTRRSPATTSYVLRRLLSSEARAQIQKAIDASPVVLFMKGTPELPQCGFSRAVIQVLDLHSVPPEKMQTYNVLEDPELRNGIKEFSCVYSSCLFDARVLSSFCKSEWPTVPQLYVNSEFVGDATSSWK